MGWIRETDDKPDRRPTDVVKLVAGAIAVVLTGVWAQSQSAVDLHAFRTLNDSSSNMLGFSKAVFALGSIWAVLAVVVVLLLIRKLQVAMQVAITGAGAWGIALLVNDLLGTHSIQGFSVNVRVGDGPVFPTVNVAIVTAIVLALSPFAVRLLRQIGYLLVVLVAIASMYLGAGFPSDVLGGLLLGLTVVAAVRVVLGSPGGKPSIAEIREAVVDLGYDVASVERSNLTITRAAVADVVLTSGQRLRVEAFGRDQRDGQIAAKAWHWMMFHEPGLPVFGSRLQQVEHIGYVLMLAERAGARTPTLVKTGVGGPDTALIVTTPPPGTRLSAMDAAQVTDAHLTAIWAAIGALHAAGVSHGNLDPDRIVVAADGTVAIDDLSAADAAGTTYWMDRDDGAVIVETALLVGNERAVSAAVHALGKERVAEIIPIVQPAALPHGVARGEKHLNKRLKTLRGELATAAGVEDVAPLKIRRLSLVNVGMLIGILFALVIAISSMEGIDWASVKGEFEHAIWGWALLAFVLYPLVPIAWATALMGCVNTDLPFVPTVLTQLACTFLNLITPNGIGGTALQLDYLHKEGVPVASGGSAMVLSTGVGGAIQMALFLVAAAITATAVDTSSSSDS